MRRNEAYFAKAQRLSHSGSWAFDIHSQEITHWSEETPVQPVEPVQFATITPAPPHLPIVDPIITAVRYG